MATFTIDVGLLEAVSNTIGATNCFLSKRQLEHLLEVAGIAIADDGARRSGIGYSFGLNKRDWLFNCLCNDWNTHRKHERIVRFLETVFDPVRYTGNKDAYEEFVLKINKPLMLHGWKINGQGKLVEVPKATNLEEVDRRTDEFRRELAKRCVHQRVYHYCNQDLLKNDYRTAVLEAAKGLADRIREMTGLRTDGVPLFNMVFAKDNPWLVFVDLQNPNGCNEQNGLCELLCSIFHMVRNPMSHRPKIHWDMERNQALDMFVLISYVHKCLDECVVNLTKKR